MRRKSSGTSEEMTAKVRKIERKRERQREKVRERGGGELGSRNAVSKIAAMGS